MGIIGKKEPVNNSDSSSESSIATSSTTSTDTIGGVVPPPEDVKLSESDMQAIEKYVNLKYEDVGGIKEIRGTDTVGEVTYVYCSDKEGIPFIVLIQNDMYSDTYAYYYYSAIRKEWENEFVNNHFKTVSGDWSLHDKEFLYGISDALLTGINDNAITYKENLNNIGQTWNILVKEWTVEDSKKFEESIEGLEGTYNIYVTKSDEEKVKFDEMVNNRKAEGAKDDSSEFNSLCYNNIKAFSKCIIGGNVIDSYIATEEELNAREESESTSSNGGEK